MQRTRSFARRVARVVAPVALAVPLLLSVVAFAPHGVGTSPGEQVDAQAASDEEVAYFNDTPPITCILFPQFCDPRPKPPIKYDAPLAQEMEHGGARLGSLDVSGMVNGESVDHSHASSIEV